SSSSPGIPLPATSPGAGLQGKRVRLANSQSDSSRVPKPLASGVAMKRLLAPILLLAVLFAGAALPLRAQNAARRPNVILILADDLGYTDVACYGSKYYETPNIDRLAAQGMRFTSGYTCGPNCQPTRAALMSGQYGPRTGVYTVGSIDRF